MKSNHSRAIYFQTEQLKTELKKKALRGAGATIFSQGTNFLINFLATIVLARILTPSDFGLVGMVMVFSLLFQNFGMRGFTEVTIQYATINHRMVSTLFWLHLLLSCAVSLLFIGISPFISWFYDEPRLQMICLIMPLTFLFSALSTQHLALLRRNMQFYRVTASEIISQTTSSIIAISLALQGWGYWALVARRIAIPLFSALPAWIFCRWKPGLPGKIPELRNIIRFAMNTYGNFFINYCSRHLDYLLIGWRYGAVPLGNYQKAYDLFVLPANQLTYPLTNVFVATLSRYRSNPEQFRSVYLKALGLLSFVAMPLSPILTLTGSDIMLLLLGPQWDEAGRIFSAFGVSIGVMVVYGTHGWLHLSLGTPNKWFRWGLLEFITTATLFLIGLPFGAVGVACGWSASYYVLLVPGLWIAGKSIDLKVSSYVSVIWKYFLSALLAGLSTWYLLYNLHQGAAVFSELNQVLRIVVSACICGGIYLVLVVVLHWSFRPILQFFSILKEMIPDIKNKQGT